MSYRKQQWEGVGVDIVEIEAIRKARSLKRFAEFFLTKQEMRRLPKYGIEQYLASRFALKEAVIKSLPVAVSPLDFEITKSQNKPVVNFLAVHLSMYRTLVSLSHSHRYAIGYAHTYQTEK